MWRGQHGKASCLWDKTFEADRSDSRLRLSARRNTGRQSRPRNATVLPYGASWQTPYPGRGQWSCRMSFLPGSLTPALPRSYCRKVISPFRRSFCFEIGICFIWIFLRNCFENKKADYTKYHKSAGASLLLQRMFYVISF